MSTKQDYSISTFYTNIVGIVGIGVARIFDWGRGQTTNHMQRRHQKLRQENFLWGQRYRGMENQKPRPCVGT